ncbi:MAG: DUF2007 domain-containing protein [Algibacter sp.]
MSNSNYIKIYSGSSIFVQRIVLDLENQNIFPVIKDETESARITGYINVISPDFQEQEIYVHKDELDKAILIVENITSELQH